MLWSPSICGLASFFLPLFTEVPSTTLLVMRYAGGHGPHSEHTQCRAQSFERSLARDCRVPRALRLPVSSLPEPSLPGALHNRAPHRPRSQELRHHLSSTRWHLHRALAASAYRCRLGLPQARWRSREVLERKKPQRGHPSVGRHLLSQTRQGFGGSSSPVLRSVLGKRANCQVVLSAEYLADEPQSCRPLHWPL